MGSPPARIGADARAAGGTALCLRLQVRAGHRFGDHRRLGFAFDLDRDLRNLLDHVGLDFLDVQQPGAAANALADVHRVNEADPIQPVVDAHTAWQSDLDTLPPV